MDKQSSERRQPKKPAGRTAAIAVGLLAFSFACTAIQSGMNPTTQMGALLPGMIAGGAGFAAIILFVVALIQAIQNWRAK